MIFNLMLIKYFSLVPDIVRLFSIVAAIYYSIALVYGIILTAKAAINFSATQISENMTTFAIFGLKYFLPAIGLYIISSMIHNISSNAGNTLLIVSIFLTGIVLIFLAAGLLAMAVVALYFTIIKR